MEALEQLVNLLKNISKDIGNLVISDRGDEWDELNARILRKQYAKILAILHETITQLEEIINVQ